MSQSQFFSQYLANIQLNKEAVDWAREDLSYLRPAVFDAALSKAVQDAREISAASIVQTSCSAEKLTEDNRMYGLPLVKARYSSFEHYVQLANVRRVEEEKRAEEERGDGRGKCFLRLLP